MVRYTWSNEKVGYFMLHAIPNGYEIGLGSNSVFWIYGKKTGDALGNTNHITPEPYGSWYNTFSIKSGYKNVQIDRKGTFDDVIVDEYSGNNYEYRSSVTNSNLPKAVSHGTHQTALNFVVWYKMYVPNSVDSTQLQTWQTEVNDNYPNCDLTKAPHPVLAPISKPKPKPFFFNDYNSRNIIY